MFTVSGGKVSSDFTVFARIKNISVPTGLHRASECPMLFSGFYAEQKCKSGGGGGGRDLKMNGGRRGVKM